MSSVEVDRVAGVQEWSVSTTMRRTFGARGRLVLGVAAGMALCLLSVPAALAQPVVVETVNRSLGGGNTARGFFATVNLSDPAVEIVTTGTAPAGSGDSVLTTVPTWRTSVGARLAINANYFSTLTGGRSDIIGLAISDGVLVSPARQFGVNPDPAIAFMNDRTARVDYIAAGAYSGIVDAVAGVGPSNTDSVPGTFLIENGVGTGSTARVDPSNRNPRTAVGVSQDGTKLYIAVIDGRNAGGSAGMTLPELATFMLEKNVWRAVNLDGGGSSSFVWQNDSGTVVQNVPSDGSFRAVANHLGVRINTAPNGADGITRPIRGAWMRPPTPVAGATTPPAYFESALQTMASIGLTDLFLETLYHGRDTGATGQTAFPQRFSFDYLRAATQMANRYGVRIHAWCETGYLDFGAQPSALLAANPDWVVKHVSVARNEATNPDPCTSTALNTLTGDLANQRFVNLGNPGVRAVLNSYFASLTDRYYELEGIQADYHFFPIGNPPANLDNVTPWSYDNWARANFRTAAGVLRDPLLDVTTCSGGTANSNWLTWNRNNVTEALRQLRVSVDGVSSSPLFSAVSFGPWDSGIHRSKAIDLPAWGNVSLSDAYFIMAYNSSTTGINNDLLAAQTALPNRRVVAGLANLAGSRPSVGPQMTTAQGRGLHDFAWFRVDEFIDGVNANAGVYRTELSNWISTQAVAIRSDVSADGVSNGRDGRVDGEDWRWFYSVYTGTSIARTATNDRCDINRDAVIDAADEVLFRRDFSRHSFGDDGVVDSRDMRSLTSAYSTAATGLAGVMNRWDLNGDGRVNLLDQRILEAFLTSSVSFATDVDGDGVTSIDDLYAFALSPTDVCGDAVPTDADAVNMNVIVRGGEQAGMRGVQR
jgi:uncharacterized lipoprotein YddW (UPF0748 family)